MRRTSLQIAALLLCLTVELQAQTSGYVRVKSNLEHIAVYADTLYLSDASESFVALMPGKYTISAIRLEDIAAWDSPRPSTSIELNEGDSLVVDLKFPNIYRFNSFPMGARVTDEEGTELGTTPFTFSSDEVLEGEITLTKNGYESLVLADQISSDVNVILSVIDNEGEGNIEAFKRKPQPVRGKLVTASIVAGTAIAAGLSIHYKFKADRLYDEYVDVTDPELRPNILKYDRYAGAALGAMQGGLVLLAVRLAF